MRFLFVHQNFPGQYLHIVRHLAANPANEVLFIAELSPAEVPGVRRLSYSFERGKRLEIHPGVQDYEVALHRADKVAAMAKNLKSLGFHPDIIIGHQGWGEMLHLADIWPGAPMLGYFEFYYNTLGFDVNFDPEFPMQPNYQPRVRAMNAINHAALALGQHGQTPTKFQLSAYPAWAQPQIQLLPEGVRLDLCRPDPKAATEVLEVGGMRIGPGDKLVTYVARNLEPYRGFHTMMRALPRLLAERPDAKVVMLGGDGISYGSPLDGETWRAHFTRLLAGQYDAARVAMPGNVPYETHLRLLQRSDAHVYLTYPFVASWSLREAMACGCAIIGSDVEPVREFVADRKTGRLVRPLDHDATTDAILEVLEDQTATRKLRRAARRYAEQNLDVQQHIRAFESRIAELAG